jgi:hypothetical protein
MSETIENVEQAVEEVLIPSGGRGIRLENGGVLNPSLASLKSVVRAGPRDFELILQWLRDERAREAARLVSADEALAEARAKIVREAEASAKAREALKRERPWAF